ncbi:splicing factor U2af large subunit A [Lolium perenne]|uniref:splicing factor U2af large subunit A n=1 Tax=Lolium perenne TaxID=4522 RepID=UPI0021EA4111|nr:splicing factor U2af large subunit A-like [Lolium perenne]
MANHGDLSPPADERSEQQPIPVIYTSRYGRTPEGTPISYQLYYKPLAPSATRRLVYEDGATKVLRLINMISPDQLEDDEYYRKFCLRVTEEGQRYGGKLVRTVVPRPDPSGAPVAGVGKVFLEYADLDSSTYSKAMLHWMWFRGKHVMALFYPEDKFANGDYDG